MVNSLSVANASLLINHLVLPPPHIHPLVADILVYDAYHQGEGWGGGLVVNVVPTSVKFTGLRSEFISVRAYVASAAGPGQERRLSETDSSSQLQHFIRKRSKSHCLYYKWEYNI